MKTYRMVIKQCKIQTDQGKRNGQVDLAISHDGTIAGIEESLDETDSNEVIHANGNFITPGLIDLHTHVYWGATYWGVEPDPLAAKTGVTTWVDAGSAGAYNFPGFRKYVVERSNCRIFSFLNIAATGLTDRTGELARVNEVADVDMAIKTIDGNCDVIKGIKVRMDRGATQGTGLEGLKRARQVADATGLPIMVHIGIAPPFLTDIAPYLKAGDILTHFCTGHSNRLIDNLAMPLPITKHLKDKGVIFDVGHGSGSFSFDCAEALLQNGYTPDVISSDMHQVSRQNVMFDLPHTMSKFLCLGMSLDDVIDRVTTLPAKILGKEELSKIQVGCRADLALWKIEDGQFTFTDCSNQQRIGKQMLINVATIIKGKMSSDVKERACHPWATRDFAKVTGINEYV